MRVHGRGADHDDDVQEALLNLFMLHGGAPDPSQVFAQGRVCLFRRRCDRLRALARQPGLLGTTDEDWPAAAEQDLAVLDPTLHAELACALGARAMALLAELLVEQRNKVLARRFGTSSAAIRRARARIARVVQRIFGETSEIFRKMIPSRTIYP